MDGTIPDLSNLQIFGAECLVLTPDQERQKWDMKCKPCLFLGYVEDSEYYRVYNPNTGKIIRSPSISFELNPSKSLFPEPLIEAHQLPSQEKQTDDQPNASSLRRSTRNMENPQLQHYKSYHGFTATDMPSPGCLTTPKTYKEAMSDPQASKWEAAL